MKITVLVLSVVVASMSAYALAYRQCRQNEIGGLGGGGLHYIYAYRYAWQASLFRPAALIEGWWKGYVVFTDSENQPANQEH
jgi:hypothetical protein